MLAAVKWAGALAAAMSLAALAVLFMLAGNPDRLANAMRRLERYAPSMFAGMIARIVQKFAIGLGTIRRPGRLFVALAWSFPLWLSIDAGIWAVAVAFGFNLPFTGSFLLVPLLTLGVAVPTPGAIGGFHEAFRLGMTVFYGVPNDAAVIVRRHFFAVPRAIHHFPFPLGGAPFLGRRGIEIVAEEQLAAFGEQGLRLGGSIRRPAGKTEETGREHGAKVEAETAGDRKGEHRFVRG